MSVSNLVNGVIDNYYASCVASGAWGTSAMYVNFGLINGVVYLSVPTATGSSAPGNPNLVFTFNTPIPNKYRPDYLDPLGSTVVPCSLFNDDLKYTLGNCKIENDGTKITFTVNGSTFTGNCGVMGQTLTYNSFLENEN